MACGWVKQRAARGGFLADKQAIQWMIADSEVELRAARLLVYDAATKVDEGLPGKVDASVCKLYGTETAGRVVDRAMQMFGGMGMANEMPLERWYRELRVKRIGEGPSRSPSHGHRPRQAPQHGRGDVFRLRFPHSRMERKRHHNLRGEHP